MTRRGARRPKWLSAIFYIIGGVWMFIGFAVLVSLPVAALVGLVVGIRAGLVYLGAQ